MREEHTSFGRRARVIGRTGQIAVSSLDPGSGIHATSIDERCSSKEYLSLEIVRCGRMTIRQSGQTLEFCAGDMLLLDPSLEFSRVFQDGAHISAVHISKRALEVRGLSWLFINACHAIRQTGDMAAVRELLITVTDIIDSASDALLERIVNQVLDLMDIVLDSGGVAPTGPSANFVVLQATRLITERLFDNELSMSAMAKQLNMSISSLSRAFRRYGVSTMRYVYALRLEHAGRLLADRPDLAIGEVGIRCGFVDPAHFSRVFKKEYGMTPRQYAKTLVSRESHDAVRSSGVDRPA
jgi:AraC-like DNA-binding protein